MRIINLIFIFLLSILCLGAGNTDYIKAKSVKDMTGTWTNPTDVLSLDGLPASANADGDTLDVISFNRFEIPYQAKIHGIEVLVNAQESCGLDCATQGSVTISLSNDSHNSFPGTTATFTPFIDSYDNFILGDSGDMWGMTFDPNHFNDGVSFAVRILWNTDDATSQLDVDYLTARVWFALDDNDQLEYLDFPSKH